MTTKVITFRFVSVLGIVAWATSALASERCYSIHRGPSEEVIHHGSEIFCAKPTSPGRFQIVFGKVFQPNTECTHAERLVVDTAVEASRNPREPHFPSKRSYKGDTLLTKSNNLTELNFYRNPGLASFDLDFQNNGTEADRGTLETTYTYSFMGSDQDRSLLEEGEIPTLRLMTRTNTRISRFKSVAITFSAPISWTQPDADAESLSKTWPTRSYSFSFGNLSDRGLSGSFLSKLVMDLGPQLKDEYWIEVMFRIPEYINKDELKAYISHLPQTAFDPKPQLTELFGRTHSASLSMKQVWILIEKYPNLFKGDSGELDAAWNYRYH